MRCLGFCGIVMAAGVFLAGGCAVDREFAPDVVATYDGGIVTEEDLEARILQEQPGQRVPPLDGEITMADWRREFAKRIVAERTWLDSSLAEEIRNDPTFQSHQKIARYSRLKTFVRRRGMGSNQPVAEDEVQELYEERRERLSVPETFTLRHVFVRVPEGRPDSDWHSARKRAVKVRELMRAPDADLDRVVAENSDSENKMQGGWIRRLNPGLEDLSQSFVAAIGSLNVGEVSAPIRTRNGWQVVLLVDRNPSRELSYEEVKERLFSQIMAARQAEQMDKFVLRMRREDPLDLDLEAVAAAEPEFVVLAGADGTLMTYEELSQREPGWIARLKTAVEKNSDEQSALEDQILEQVWLVRYGEREGLDADPEFLKGLELLRDRNVIEAFIARSQKQWFASQRPEEIREFYEDNRSRFQTPRRLHLYALYLRHENEDRWATFRLAETLRDQLADGAVLGNLVAQYSDLPGPEGEGDFGWVTHQQIAAAGKQFYDEVLEAELDVWIGPIKWDSGYAIIQIVAIEDPVELSFEEVEDRVSRAYARRNFREYLDGLTEEVFLSRDGSLNEAHFNGER